MKSKRVVYLLKFAGSWTETLCVNEPQALERGVLPRHQSRSTYPFLIGNPQKGNISSVFGSFPRERRVVLGTLRDFILRALLC